MCADFDVVYLTILEYKKHRIKDENNNISGII